MESRKLLNGICTDVRNSVVLTDVSMTSYVLWLILTDTAHWLPGALFSWTPLGIWMLLRASRLFHLCIIHKLMIIHSGLIYACCIYQAHYGFGIQLPYMRWCMFLSGMYLFIWLCIRRKCFKNDC